MNSQLYASHVSDKTQEVYFCLFVCLFFIWNVCFSLSSNFYVCPLMKNDTINVWAKVNVAHVPRRDYVHLVLNIAGISPLLPSCMCPSGAWGRLLETKGHSRVAGGLSPSVRSPAPIEPQMKWHFVQGSMAPFEFQSASPPPLHPLILKSLATPLKRSKCTVVQLSPTFLCSIGVWVGGWGC